MANQGTNPQIPNPHKPNEEVSSYSTNPTTPSPDIEDILLDLYESWVQNPNNRLFPKGFFDWDFEDDGRERHESSSADEERQSSEDGKWKKNKNIDELVMKIKSMEIQSQEKGKKDELQRIVAKLEGLKLGAAKGGD